MTNPLTTAVLKAGLIHPTHLAEFKRWKSPVEIPDDVPERSPQQLDQAVSAIEEALQSEGYVLTRETDLEALHQYLETRQQGTLHVEIFSTDPTIERVANIPLSYGVTPLGEYIIPWKSDSISDEMTNGMTYLHTLQGDVHFSEVKELFFGENKAFMLCTPKKGEDNAGSTST